MKTGKPTNLSDLRTVADLKTQIIANAIATGNTFAFHDLFSKIAEFSDGNDESVVNPQLLNHLVHLLPGENDVESPGHKDALTLLKKNELKDDAVPATLLEETAKEAVRRGKFAYAEDTYRLLGIKNELVGLYAQAGEQFLREDRPKHAALSFFIAASIDQPIGPHYQYLGYNLHSGCLVTPEKCATNLPTESLVEEAIHFLLSNQTLSQRLLDSASPEQRNHVLAALAVCRNPDLAHLIRNLRATVAEFTKIADGKPDDYSAIGATLLGRTTASGEAWQYLREFCFEHPIGSLCVCVKVIHNTPVLVPVMRDGRSVLEMLLPDEYLTR